MARGSPWAEAAGDGAVEFWAGDVGGLVVEEGDGGWDGGAEAAEGEAEGEGGCGGWRGFEEVEGWWGEVPVVRAVGITLFRGAGFVGAAEGEEPGHGFAEAVRVAQGSFEEPELRDFARGWVEFEGDAAGGVGELQGFEVGMEDAEEEVGIRGGGGDGEGAAG